MACVDWFKAVMLAARALMVLDKPSVREACAPKDAATLVERLSTRDAVAGAVLARAMLRVSVRKEAEAAELLTASN